MEDWSRRRISWRGVGGDPAEEKGLGEVGRRLIAGFPDRAELACRVQPRVGWPLMPSTRAAVAARAALGVVEQRDQPEQPQLQDQGHCGRRTKTNGTSRPCQANPSAVTPPAAGATPRAGQPTDGSELTASTVAAARGGCAPRLRIETAFPSARWWGAREETSPEVSARRVAG